MVKYVCDHIHLKAKDVDKTVQWYVDTLGAKVTFEGRFKGSKVLYFDISGFTFICFGQLEDEEGENAPIEPTLRTRFGNDHFGFQIDNMDEAVAEKMAAKEDLKRQELPDPPGEDPAWQPWLQWKASFPYDVQTAIDWLLAAEGARTLANQAFSGAPTSVDAPGYTATTLKDVGLEAILAAAARNVSCS